MKQRNKSKELQRREGTLLNIYFISSIRAWLQRVQPGKENVDKDGDALSQFFGKVKDYTRWKILVEGWLEMEGKIKKSTERKPILSGGRNGSRRIEERRN